LQTTVSTISGTTRLYGIVGDPIDQVRSPEVFNAQFTARGVDAVFLPLHVRPAEVQSAFKGFTALANLDGLIITVPHKMTFAGLVDELGPRARVVNAVNTLRRMADGRWIGELFDGVGFVEGLRARGVDPSGLSYLVVGAGGAGSAISAALLEAAPKRVAITDTVSGKAAALCAALARAVAGCPVAEAGPDIDPAAFDVVVNATPLGMKEDDPLPVDVARLRPGTLVAEAVMKPPVTRLLREAARQGCHTHPGHLMLDSQVSLVLDFFGIPD